MGAGQDHRSPSELEIALGHEFDRLNREHFAGKLRCPEIVVSTRKSFGGYYRPREHRIVVSWQAYLEHGWDESLNTFRHEVAHIVHFNHSRDFWELATRLGVKGRYAKSPIAPPKRHHYTYVCPGCHARVIRYRRLRKASCARCDKNFNPKFLLKLVPNS